LARIAEPDEEEEQTSDAVQDVEVIDEAPSAE
jgi:hypothetical protein